MRDDHRYSRKRIVFYQHPNPHSPHERYGESGPERTCGSILDVIPDPSDESSWLYTIQNWHTGEVCTVAEPAIICGASPTHRRGTPRRPGELESVPNAEHLQQELNPSLSSFVKTHISELVEQENQQDIARAEGSDLPLAPGDYIRLSGEFRQCLEPYHALYAKILDVQPAEISALEIDPAKWAGQRIHHVRTRYTVQIEDGSQLQVYDPEVKRYYTTRGRTSVLNWRAAAFLAEIFGDEPPYHVDYEFYESHIFTRAELEGLTREKLVDTLINLLYVKGQLGLQDYEARSKELLIASDEYLIDNILFLSRFDMRRNRPMTREEILERLDQQSRLSQILEGS